MKNRLISASILLVLAVMVFGLNGICPLALNAVFLLLVFLGLFECFKVTGFLKKTPLMVLSGLFVAAFSAMVALNNLKYAILTVLLFILGLIILLVVNHKEYTYANISFVLMTTLYVSFGFTSLMIVKDRHSEIGTFIVFLVLFGSWISDVGGWLFGMLFGRHKLSPQLSPKKTIEGAVGSFALTFIFFMLSAIGYSHFTGETMNYILLAVLSLPFTAATIIGDLAASALKRETGVKDFSNLFPGHGGVMDRFDSMLFSSVFMLIALEFVNFI